MDKIFQQNPEDRMDAVINSYFQETLGVNQRFFLWHVFFCNFCGWSCGIVLSLCMVLGCKFSIQHSISMIIFLVSRGKQSIMDTILGFDHSFFISLSEAEIKLFSWQISALWGPRTIHTKLQKMYFFSMHTTSFFTTAKILFHSFIYGQRFLQICFRKFFAVLCIVYKGQKHTTYLYA